MIVPHVTFIRPVPVLGTWLRQDHFSFEDGWIVDVHDYGVTLSRPANPSQNVPEVEAFCICGVGYSVPVVEAPAAVEGKTAPGIGRIVSEAALGNATVSGEQLLAAGALQVGVDAVGAPVYARKGKR